MDKNKDILYVYALLMLNGTPVSCWLDLALATRLDSLSLSLSLSPLLLHLLLSRFLLMLAG